MEGRALEFLRILPGRFLPEAFLFFLDFLEVERVIDVDGTLLLDLTHHVIRQPLREKGGRPLAPGLVDEARGQCEDTGDDRNKHDAVVRVDGRGRI